LPSLASVSSPTILVLSACQPPGAEIAKAFADARAHVIVMGGDAAGLTQIAARSPEQIEPLFINGGQVEALRLLGDAWGAEPIDLVINLMPLAYPHHITEQMRGLSMIMRTFGRGLVAGKGVLVSVAARPDDPLALVGQGMCAALGAAGMALADALASKSLRVHTVTVPKQTPEWAVETLLFLGGAQSRHIKSTTFDLTQ
tara:strand:+ start:4856 stop:5455 length:600 start_codon:yes stop_codon:yes gene_type:complete